MERLRSARMVLIAVGFFALGFVASDRMTSVTASPVRLEQDSTGAGFSGVDGAVVVKTHLLLFRGRKIYKLDPLAPGGAQKPWGELSE